MVVVFFFLTTSNTTNGMAISFRQVGRGRGSVESGGGVFLACLPACGGVFTCSWEQVGVCVEESEGGGKKCVSICFELGVRNGVNRVVSRCEPVSEGFARVDLTCHTRFPPLPIV